MRGRDMQEIYKVFQNFWGIISNISKKAYRNCAVLMTGAAVIALISFNSKEFGGSGKNKSDAIKPLSSGILVKTEESSEDELLLQTEEIVSVSVRDTEVFVRESGQTEYKQSQEKEITPAQPAELTETQELTATPGLTATPESTATPEPTVMLTQELVAEPVCVYGQTVVALDAKNYQVLLRIVEAEASGEGVEGKKLVANVILNRVNHPSFPNTVEEVVFQKSGGSAQFSPTIDGRFESVVISDETVEAVDMVLAGADNSQGALFFSARSKADPDNMSWFDKNLKWLFVYGGHEFYTLP